MWFIYLIQSGYDNSYYIGISQNPNQRLTEHNKGKSRYTKGKMPWTIVYFEAIDVDVKVAREKEKYYKKTENKRKLLDKILSGGPQGSLSIDR
jgi:predicted GIY-YIG superfamily endonuclease